MSAGSFLSRAGIERLEGVAAVCDTVVRKDRIRTEVEK
jgi:hypothetical protein